MPIIVIIGTALVTGLAAMLLTPWMKRVAATTSGWLDSHLHVVLAAGDPGRLYALEDRHRTKGTLESSVLDAKLVSRWGALSWRADVPGKTGVSVAVRSGNVEEPDETWSEWSGEHTGGVEVKPGVPSARYLQYRVTLTSPDGQATPEVRSLTIRYATGNLAPEARACPPPPNVAQISQTLTSALFDRIESRTVPSRISSRKAHTTTPRIARITSTSPSLSPGSTPRRSLVACDKVHHAIRPSSDRRSVSSRAVSSSTRRKG